MKSWILFSLVLITKLSLPLTVHPPTSVKVRTLTLYRENKSSSYQAIFKASGKKTAKYPYSSFFLVFFLFFLPFGLPLNFLTQSRSCQSSL